MPAPNNQIAGLGLVDTHEICVADVEFARSDIVVGEPGLSVNVVNEMGTVRFGFRVGARARNGGQNLAALCFGYGTRFKRAHGGWPDILAEGCRGHRDREAQHYEYESASHSLSLADRGESRTDYAANRALS